MTTKPAAPLINAGLSWTDKLTSFVSRSDLRQVWQAHYQLILLFVIIFLLVLKGPGLFIHPRIWAEEVYYLNHALTHNIWVNLVYSKPSVGYYLLTANVPTALAAIAAKTLGLQYAPAVTTYFSFLIQVLPFVILVYGRSHLFSTRSLVLLGSLLMLIAPTTSGEIWLTSIHTKSWTGLATFIILFEDLSNWSKKRVWLFRFLLLFLGLSGPYGAILCPLFLLSYFIYHEREKLVQGSILAFCCLIHGCFYLVETHSGLIGMRSQAFTADSAIVNVFLYQVIWPFWGEHSFWFCRHFLHLQGAIQKASEVPRVDRVFLAAAFCAGLTIILFLIFQSRRIRSSQCLLIASFLLFSTFTAVTALKGIPHNRYTLLPGLAILFFVLDAQKFSKSVVRILATTLLVCTFCNGLHDYRKFWTEMSAGEPAWSDEVQKWRVDPSYSPVVWPTIWKGLDSYPDTHVLDWHPETRK